MNAAEEKSNDRFVIDYRVPLPWVIAMVFALLGNLFVGLWFGAGFVHSQEQQGRDIGELKGAVLKLVDVQVNMAVLTTRVLSLEAREHMRREEKEGRR
jgi:hypothetical protein